MFFTGLFIKYLILDSEKAEREFDYSYQDSIFASKMQSDTSELIQKKVDSDQELLDFNTYELNLRANSQNNLAPASIDINSAAREELVILPGIGEKTADAIIRHREKFGKFKTAEALMNVKGIGVKKLEKIRKYIYVK